MQDRLCFPEESVSQSQGWPGRLFLLPVVNSGRGFSPNHISRLLSMSHWPSRPDMRYRQASAFGHWNSTLLYIHGLQDATTIPTSPLFLNRIGPTLNRKRKPPRNMAPPWKLFTSRCFIRRLFLVAQIGSFSTRGNCLQRFQSMVAGNVGAWLARRSEHMLVESGKYG